MSLECVELWRPRREPRERGFEARVLAAQVVLFLGALVVAVALRRPSVLAAGAALFLAFAWARRRSRRGPVAWVPASPRRWVSRGSGDRRSRPDGDRRAHRRVARPGPRACRTQRPVRPIAISRARSI